MNGERVIAFAQICLTVLFTLGFFLVTAIVLFGRASIPADQLRLADTLFGVLGTIMAQQSSYWFARQRVSPPDKET